VQLPNVLTLQNLANVSSEEAGELAKQLAALAKAGVPITPTLVLTNETLHHLYRHHQDTSKKVLKAYHQVMNGDFVSIQYQTDRHSQPLLINNVIGDSNLLHTLEQSAASIGHHPVILQAQPQPEFSGTATTFNPETNSKTQISVVATQGVYDQTSQNQANTYNIDFRSGEVVSSSLAPQTQQFVRKMDSLDTKTVKKSTQDKHLTNSQISALAKIVISAKQSTHHQLKLNWYYVDKQFFISQAVPFHNSKESSLADQVTLLCMGTSLTGGYIEGVAWLPDASRSKKGPNLIPPNSILVAKTLTKKNISIIKKVSAVVTEQPIGDREVLNLITRFHIPAVVNASFITKVTRSYQSLIVDAGSGKIFAPKISPTTTSTSQKTSLKINKPGLQKLVLAGNPHHLKLKTSSGATGIVLSSNYSVALHHTHPAYLVQKKINTSQNQFTLNLISTLKPFFSFAWQNWFYFPLTLNSRELASLDHSTSHSEPEENPEVGKRGAIAILENQTIFLAEMSAVQELAKQTQPNIVIPFVKTTAEFQLITKLTHQKIPQSKSWQFWAHASTPVAVQSLLVQDIKTVLDLDRLHAAWHGIDTHQANLQNSYPFNSSGIFDFLNDQIKKTASPPPTLLMSRTHHPQAVLDKVHWKAAGFITTANNIGKI
jgi:phosphoenolpyruvate synthase/pyruvate phosphate dikinase